MLEGQVSVTPSSLPLIESSQSLALFAADAPDLWPMSCDPKAAAKASSERDRARENESTHSSTSSSALAAKSAAAAAAAVVAASCAYEGCGGEYGGGSASIEIPGSYVPNTATFQDCKPCPELHAKLIRFESRVAVIRRNEQLVRRIGMVGSDGKTHRFLLQFAIPYWTRTDERTAQLHYLFNKILRSDTMASRSYLNTQPDAVIPIAQRLRMTIETPGRLSLDDVLRQHCESTGQSPESFFTEFHDHIESTLNKDAYEAAGQTEKALMERKARLKAFAAMSSSEERKALLQQAVAIRLTDPESLYHFRRCFADHLAINSLFQHAFSVVPRNPSRMVMSTTNGRVLSPEFRFSYSNQGESVQTRVGITIVCFVRFACCSPF